MHQRLFRGLKWLASGAIVFQLAGCENTTILDLLQTAFLGVTAAGSFVILQNI